MAISLNWLRKIVLRSRRVNSQLYIRMMQGNLGTHSCTAAMTTLSIAVSVAVVQLHQSAQRRVSGQRAAHIVAAVLTACRLP